MKDRSVNSLGTTNLFLNNNRGYFLARRFARSLSGRVDSTHGEIQSLRSRRR